MTKESIISAVESHPALADTTMRPSNQWSVSSKDKYCGWSNVNVGWRWGWRGWLAGWEAALLCEGEPAAAAVAR